MKYMHIRKRDLRGAAPKGGITIAYQLEPKARTATCGIAFCSLQDRYSKEDGRSIARGRIISQPLQITMDGVITCYTIAQVVRTLLVEWDLDQEALEKFFKRLGLQVAHKNPTNPSIFFANSDAVSLKAQRYPTVWETILMGPGGTQAVLRVDGKKDRTCGWINLVPRWARKVGWTWI